MLQRSRDQLTAPGFGQLRYTEGGPGGARGSRDDHGGGQAWPGPVKKKARKVRNPAQRARQGANQAHPAAAQTPPLPAPHQGKGGKNGGGKGKARDPNAKNAEGKYLRSRENAELC